MVAARSGRALDVVDIWCDGACRNNGGVNPNLPVLAGVGVYCPTASREDRRYHRALPWLKQGPDNVGPTSNRELVPTYVH